MLKHGSADILSSLGFCIPTAPLGSTWEITTANSDHCMVACERNWRVPGDKDVTCLYEDTQMICHVRNFAHSPAEPASMQQALRPTKPGGLCRESDLPMNKRITTSNHPQEGFQSVRPINFSRQQRRGPSRKRCNHTTQINATTAMNGVIGPRKDDHVSVHALTF
ncbi:hypothetical protein FGSG_08705 [Fusarium graminearum PH-1]|uniref:hypothetical protein n=1 Tax=Gibberella zeae (strain ATCC MYA-4620 / CBS 123657 / FGSC 9075 / NRRL 31084 / PH-1) TaxID=229533 RepID=UPI000023E8FC|nr:hypothetical protein FGSG_08705 [Fusarium graminearum PH-1]ESU14604.1 hypothetical protein FGSG_08705 [Fusarium graminearum PH-1]|eukprot:XP_011320029.1 hypothetical protein FGSG_08705 [Fusarium graminearum PH-1]